MKHEYILKNLGCANCATKIEEQVKALPGIESATLNFATGALNTVCVGDERCGHEQKIEKIIKSIEPNVKIFKKDNEHIDEKTHDNSLSEKIIVRLVISSIAFIIALMLLNYQVISIAFFALAYVVSGYDVIITAFKNLFRGAILDENFLISIASLGAMAIGEYPEGVAVMLFYQVGEFFQNRAVNHSKKSIAELMNIRPDYANIVEGEEMKKVSPYEVKKGDIIVVRPGEKVPLDGIVVSGSSMLDTSALTGESVPRKVEIGSEILSGCINQNGVLKIEVAKEFSQSTVSKILDLVQNASSKKSPTENFITTFAKYYTPTVVIIAILLALIFPLAFAGEWSVWTYRALVFLVVSCPCALVISIPLGFFGGIGGASKNGILIKGGNFLEALSKADTVVFDKTGTLTEGVFEVQKVICDEKFNEQSVLRFAACAESFSSHPIALSIKKAYSKDILQEKLDNYNETSGYGASVKLNNFTVLVGNDKLMKKFKIDCFEPNDFGTKVFVAVDGVFAGCIIISDRIKDDSKKAVSLLGELGVRKTVMLTGDREQVANSVAKELGLDEVYAELLPQQKVEKLEELLKNVPKNRKLLFVGDGINDAPVLARADVGIAMGALGSDAAIEAADVVIMTDGPSKVATAIKIARFTKKVVTQNIVFALLCKLVVLILGAFGVATMWEAVFVDVGVCIIAVFNSIRASMTGRYL